ncbi:MAG: glycosyltransferase [Phycisphaerae bacterium]
MAGSDHRTLKVAVETHFLEVDGKVFTDISFPYPYWREYLAVFDEVIAIARVRRAAAVPEGWIRADGDRVRFRPVYDYLGFWQFLRHLPRIFGECWRAVSGSDPVLMRMGNISFMCWIHLTLRGRPYAFEVVGHAGLGATRVRNVRWLKLGHLIGWLQHRFCRLTAARAACASYVSEYVRSLYPTRTGREWVFSSVNLPDEVFRDPRPAGSFDHSPKRIISVGRIEPEKGHQVLIRAAREMKDRGRVGFTMEIAGPGSRIEPLRRLAVELGVADCVRLVGPVEHGAPLRAFMDNADLFVLPSLTEGMPRALLEAMARGIPAVGSRTGGIVELLDVGRLVAPGDASALARLMTDVLQAPADLAAMSAASIRTARKYHLAEMNRRKHAFWRCVAELGR